MSALLVMVAGIVFEAAADGVRALHGGQLQKGGKHYYEMTLREADPVLHSQEVTLYVYDAQGRPLMTHNSTVRAVVVSGREKVSLDLPPVGDNRLAGSALFTPQSGTQMLVTASWSDDQFPEQVKFSLTPAKTTGR
ncbi:MAG: hypothetical protein HQL60_09005 [Magnetococcales bacterium]|nr:hypothetical protein [Magnetococcales bacterium]